MLARTSAAVAVAIAVWRTVVACRRVERSVRHLAAPRDPQPRPAGPDRLGVVVPLLDEQSRLPSLLAHFAQLATQVDGLELHLVTSAREGTGSTSTYAMCRAAAERDRTVTHHHCTDPVGVMAHQLNVVRDCAAAPDALVVYNADSRPTAAALDFVRASLAHDPDAVCQQYGAYVANLEDFRGAQAPVLTAAAFWQTRWALGFELPRALDNEQPSRRVRLERRRFDPRPGRMVRMNYVVGHGLGVTRTTLAEMGAFSTRWHNEDAVLGLHLALAGRPVVPNPHLEPADSPDSVRGLVTQKAVWWTGPGLAPCYLLDRPVRAMPAGGGQRLFTAWMTAGLWHHATCWWAGPACLAAAVLAVPSAPLPALAVVAAVWAFVAWPNDLAARRLPVCGIAIPPGRRVAAALGAGPMYALHGVSGVLGACRALARLVTPDLDKPRTPMRAHTTAAAAAW